MNSTLGIDNSTIAKVTTPTTEKPKKPSSKRRIEASRANGTKSKGPIALEGKARSSHNALRHGVLARLVTLSPEGAEIY